MRVITQSRAYQLSEVPNQYNIVDRQNYSRYYPRRLQAEVLLDAIDRLAGTQTDFANLPPGTRAVASRQQLQPLVSVPASLRRPEAESVCECERVQSSSLAQSLHLLNAAELKTKLAAPTGRAERLAKEDKPAEAKIRELYLAAFSREPRPQELKTAIDYLNEPGTAANTNYQDLIWALINTKEFLFNH